MNKYTKKRRKKHIKQDKKKRTNKRASNFKINRKIEARFKNLDIKTIKELRNKFEKERLLSKSKYIVNREQIGCSNKQNSMSGGSVALTDVLQKIQDFGTSTYNGVYGYPEVASQDPTDQPYLGNNLTI
jgi:cobalamin-dependent methionine synthase I